MPASESCCGEKARNPCVGGEVIKHTSAINGCQPFLDIFLIQVKFSSDVSKIFLLTHCSLKHLAV